MKRVFFVLVLMLAVFTGFASADMPNTAIDDRFKVSFNDWDTVGIFDNGTCVHIPKESTVFISVEQYPGGRWEVDIPSVYPSKQAGKEVIQLNIPNIQGIYQITYHVPGTYYSMGAKETLILYVNIGNVGGDSYEESVYANNPHRYATIFSDPYPDISQNGKTATFRFGKPEEGPYIRSISVTMTSSKLNNDAQIILIPESSANHIPKPEQSYWNLYDVKVSGINPSDIENVDIIFGVPIGVPSNYGFDPKHDIELLRFSEHSWETLDTALVYEGEGVRQGLDWYVANSPGFSYYAVGFSENVTKLPEEIYGTPAPTTTVPTTIPTSTPVETMPTAPQQSSFGGIIGVFILGCLVILARKN